MAMVPKSLTVNPRWKLLMQSLFYPAVLGTCFVLLINKLAVGHGPRAAFLDIAVYFGLLLTLYFTVSFLIASEMPTKRYTLWSFTLDFIEIVLIFLAFTALGYLEPQRPEKMDLPLCFGYLIPIPILQQLWNWSVGLPDRGLLWLSLAGSSVAASGALMTERWPFVAAIALAALYGLMAAYFWMLLRE